VTVANGQNEIDRNTGRYFWIDNQLIPLWADFDDYGSIYPWMSCNRIGNSICWGETASSHGDTIAFDFKGYKIIKTEVIVTDFALEKEEYPIEAYRVTTVSNVDNDEWYFVDAETDDDAKMITCIKDAIAREEIPARRTMWAYQYGDYDENENKPDKKYDELLSYQCVIFSCEYGRFPLPISFPAQYPKHRCIYYPMESYRV
jgi:hypothetical protein